MTHSLFQKERMKIEQLPALRQTQERMIRDRKPHDSNPLFHRSIPRETFPERYVSQIANLFPPSPSPPNDTSPARSPAYR
jgi:hypothetical protein